MKYLPIICKSCDHTIGYQAWPTIPPTISVYTICDMCHRSFRMLEVIINTRTFDDLKSIEDEIKPYNAIGATTRFMLFKFLALKYFQKIIDPLS